MPDINKKISSELPIKLNRQEQLKIDIISGLFTGAFTSGLFNPWDRALYLSVKHNKRFLSLQNFKSPYHGFSQAILHRMIMGGSYYILQNEFSYYLYPFLREQLFLSEPAAQFCIGLSAGSISGAFTNSIAAIKYYTWGNENRSFFKSMNEMWSLGGVKPFIKGTSATVARDMVFGSTYEMLRHFFCSPHHSEMLANGTAAAIATIMSGPFNYARNIQYASPPHSKTPNVSKILRDVWHESKQNQLAPFSRIRFFQRQFKIGWGTVRVTLGITVGQTVFDLTRKKLTKHSCERDMKIKTNGLPR